MIIMTENELLINQNQLSITKSAIDSIFDMLIVKSETYNHKLPEDIFINYFLPAFSGEVQLESSVMNDWIDVAGSPTNEVDIINTKNEVIFSVPSLFDTNVINTVTKSSAPTLKTIYEGFDMRNNNIPVAASAFLKNELDKKVSDITIEGNNNSTARWATILKRYGKETGEVVDKSFTPDEDDDLIYD